MRFLRAAGTVVTLLLSLALVPPVGGKSLTVQATQPASGTLQGMFGLNGGGGGCPEWVQVDIDLVEGGAWELYSTGSIWTRDIGSGTVTPVPRLSTPWYGTVSEGECAVELVPTSRGSGYWLFTSKGRVLVAGDAVWHGDLSELVLNDPIVAAAPTPSGSGYYMLGADGGVFGFGDAQFYGSVQGIVDETVGLGQLASDHLHAPIVTMATTPAGYWLIAGDGAVFPFGDAPYYGSIQDALNTGNQLAGIGRAWTLRPPATDGVPLAKDALDAPIVDVVPSGLGAGYMMLASDGGIFNFGQTQFHGSAAGLADDYVAVASDATSTGDGYIILMKKEYAFRSLWRHFGSLRPPTHTLANEVPGNAGASIPLDILANIDAQRQIVIQKLTEKMKSGGYGISQDGFLRGPAGFEIDLNGCPEAWNNTGGITESQIRIGLTRYAHDRAEAIGWTHYFNWVNATDPLVLDGTPRDLVLLIQEDDFVSDVTVEAVHDLLTYENVFSVTTTGFFQTLAVHERMNDLCVPHPFANRSFGAFEAPTVYPWTTTAALSDFSIPLLWGAWIQENFADDTPVNVVLLAEKTGFESKIAGFSDWVSANSATVGKFQLVQRDRAVLADKQSPSARETIEMIAESEPDVLILLTGGNTCEPATQLVSDSGLLESVSVAFVSAYCAWWLSDTPAYLDGWWTLDREIKNSSSERYSDDSYVSWLKETARQVPGYRSLTGFTEGHYYGLLYVEALRIAVALPGGLTRTNFILAVRSLDFDHPLLFDGVRFTMEGSADAYPVEGAAFRFLDADLPIGEQVLQIVDVNGQTPICAWDRRTFRCQ